MPHERNNNIRPKFDLCYFLCLFTLSCSRSPLHDATVHHHLLHHVAVNLHHLHVHSTTRPFYRMFPLFTPFYKAVPPVHHRLQAVPPVHTILQAVPPVHRHSTTTMGDYSPLDACRRFARTRDERATLMLVYPAGPCLCLSHNKLVYFRPVIIQPIQPAQSTTVDCRKE